MQGTINRATLFDELWSNNLSKSHFKKYFDNMSGDVGIAFDGCESILSIPWNDIIHYSHVIMVFRKPFDQTHLWGSVFQFKDNPECVPHVFDKLLLNTLVTCAHYLNCSRCTRNVSAMHIVCNALQQNCHQLKERSKKPNINYNAASSFQSWFNNILCRYSFLSCFSSFNNYSMPILRTSNFTSFLDASQYIFPKQLAFFSSHRYIHQERDGNKLRNFKERQVFISFLILQCMSNFRCLLHWCLILSMAMYGWGTCNTLGHAASFIGTTVS
jgi:hypothetical protein